SFDYLFGQLLDRELTGVAEIHRIVQVRRIHQTNQTFDEIVDITERARLLTFTVERQRLGAQRLHGKIRDYATVVFEHVWSIGVEDARDADVDFVLTVIVSHQRLSQALAFVVTGTQTDRIDVTPVIFRLRVDQWIAVDFGSRGLKYAGAHPLCEAEHVDGAHDAGLDCLNRIVLVMNGRRGTREVIDLVHLEKYWFGHGVTQKLEERIVEQVKNVLAPAGEEIVQAEHFISLADEPLAEMRANESRSPRD